MEQGSIGRSATKRWLVRFPRAMPVAIFLLISAITVLSVFAIERGEDERATAQLRSRATAIASALEQRANASSAYLRAGAALLATLEEVPLAQFRRFVSELRLDADYRGTEGVGWAPVVYPDEIAAFEAILCSANHPLRDVAICTFNDNLTELQLEASYSTLVAIAEAN